MLEDVGNVLQSFLRGSLNREELAGLIARFNLALTSGAKSSETSALTTTLSLLDVLLDGSPCPAKLHRLLTAIENKLCSSPEAAPPRGRLPPPAHRGRYDGGLRSFLPRLFRALGPLRLCAVENPLKRPWFPLEPLFCDIDGEWVDVGLLHPRDREAAPPQLIPFSVFTSRFFHEDLPALFEDGMPRKTTDGFYYHPENDQALFLIERLPDLGKRRGDFQYFVGETGLAEIVLDTDRIETPELVFATKLFCLRNGVRRATLDGRRVVGAPGPPP